MISPVSIDPVNLGKAVLTASLMACPAAAGLDSVAVAAGFAPAGVSGEAAGLPDASVARAG